jgi:hypothetical protein
LLPAFLFVAVLLPFAGPAAIVVETFVLVVILETIFSISFPAPQLVCVGYRFGISPRSPPCC